MSLVPLLFSDWWEDLDRPHRLLDQHFGLSLSPEQLLLPSSRGTEIYQVPMSSIRERRHPRPAAYVRPWADLLRQLEAGAGVGHGLGYGPLLAVNGSGASTIENDKDRFRVVLDVQQFQPDEINVKIVDKYVVVEAKHEEKRDEHGWISRQFVRKYLIPEQCDIEQVSSNLSSDGVLTITAPRKDQPKLESERQIKIEHTGKPALQSAKAQKQQPKGKQDKDDKPPTDEK